jgi:transcriptional regulator GlxA family with amidase domain
MKPLTRRGTPCANVEVKPMKVMVVVLDGVQALDVAGPLDVFAEANTFLPEQDRYEVSFVGVSRGVVSCSNGMQVTVPFGYEDYQGNADLVLVAGGPQIPDFAPDNAFLAWLRRSVEKAGRFGSVCNGAFILGRAGLLDGRQVTTHWSDARRLAQDFPLAQVLPDKIFIRDGALFTSAGVTSGIDLCLALVAEDFGRELAVRVAKRLVVYMQREGGQSQYSPYFAEEQQEDAVIARVRQYVKEHLTETPSIEQLANDILVSRRTFSRIFAKSAHMTPLAFVEQVRIDVARGMLEETDMPLKTVAYRAGFRSAGHMRMAFSRRLGVTPRQYRERFRGSGATHRWSIAQHADSASRT